MRDATHPTKRRNVVRFRSFVEVCEIPRLNDLAETENQNIYLSRHDLFRIRYECRVAVHLIEAGHSDTLESSRGLDQYTDSYSFQIHQIRNQLYDGIHAAQLFHSKSGRDVSHFISQLSQRLSIVPTQLALSRAEVDAKEAKKETKSSTQLTTSKPNRGFSIIYWQHKLGKDDASVYPAFELCLHCKKSVVILQLSFYDGRRLPRDIQHCVWYKSSMSDDVRTSRLVSTCLGREKVNFCISLWIDQDNQATGKQIISQAQWPEAVGRAYQLSITNFAIRINCRVPIKPL